ncbi:hypothetical protein Zmor_022743 [Zophobas morio]|uniref:DNA topoisomerase 1 n=1 Tax=Zophobas morio TaxID=2755281 RepID=A0AA38HVZ6_9CUCU|nr:hypothetical protein Zmor_022743 [Zophobas morio]
MCENQTYNQTPKNEENINDQDSPKRRKTGPKWTIFQHNGPLFPPPYEPLPDHIPFKYNKITRTLSPQAEEAATFYAKITNKRLLKDDTFISNFFKDWRKVMTEEEKLTITDFSKCDFRYVRNYFKHKRKEEAFEHRKKQIEEQNAFFKEHYGFCVVDGVSQEIENYKIDSGIFEGRRYHPNTGRIKRRIQPEDVVVNCSEDGIPEAPEGHCWKKVVHDNTSTWLAKWKDDVLGEDKYVQLKASATLKMEEDKRKYETAKELNLKIVEIRKEYWENMFCDDVSVKQRAVALYFIDNFLFSTGNDKNGDKKADTVGTCSLRVEHVQLQEKGHIVVFNFLANSSIRYYNELPVEEQVFKNLQLFQEDKSPDDRLFDVLTPQDLNCYLNKQMPNLTVRVIRTYSASYIFEKFLYLFTDPNNYLDEKIRFHRCANGVVALLLNHRTTEESEFKKETILMAKQDIHYIVALMKRGEVFNKDDSRIRRLFQNLKRLLFKDTEIRLETSRLDYLDPRITVAWCKKYGVPIGRIYTKSEEMKKFKWAIELGDQEYCFSGENVLPDQE